MKWKSLLVVVATVVMIDHAWADTEPRVALVVGNSAYQSSPLANPANDAADMASALERYGFTVIRELDADRRTLRRAIREFGEKINQGAVGLFYYAGHGIQVDGENYLVPIGAQVFYEDEVPDECLEVSSVLRKMESAGNRLNIIILDACRDNPFARSFRSSTKGLAKMDAPAGSILAYATAPGSTAADGTDRNGLYTSHLLKHMENPILPLEKIFKKVRIDVMQSSKNRQVPWESSSLTGDFFFASRPQEQKVASVPAPVADNANQLAILEAEKAKLEAERIRLEAERKLAEQKQQLALEKLRMEKEQAALAAAAAEAEKRRLEAENRLLAEKQRLEAEKRRLLEEQKRQVSPPRANDPAPTAMLAAVSSQKQIKLALFPCVFKVSAQGTKTEKWYQKTVAGHISDLLEKSRRIQFDASVYDSPRLYPTTRRISDQVENENDGIWVKSSFFSSPTLDTSKVIAMGKKLQVDLVFALIMKKTYSLEAEADIYLVETGTGKIRHKNIDSNGWAYEFDRRIRMTFEDLLRDYEKERMQAG